MLLEIFIPLTISLWNLRTLSFMFRFPFPLPFYDGFVIFRSGEAVFDVYPYSTMP
jgi:hypothetical protein